MANGLIDTDRLLNLMRAYRLKGEIDKDVFLELNNAFGRHFNSQDELVHSRLHVIAHVINTYIPKAYDEIESKGVENWIREFYDSFV